MEEKNFFKVKNLTTGLIFNMSKEICDRLIKDEPNNFKVIDKDYKQTKQEKNKNKTLFEQIVVNDENSNQNKIEKTDNDKSLNDENTKVNENEVNNDNNIS